MRVVATSLDRLALGEGPLWHPLWGELLVVNIEVGDVYRFDTDLKLKGRIALGRPTSALTWQADGSLLCFQDRGDVVRLEHPAATPVVLLNIPEESDGRFNDVIADSQGRVICGALASNSSPGKLYCIEPDLRYRCLLNDLAEPNGLAFSLDGCRLHFADSVAQSIWQFDYDDATGALSNRRLLHGTTGLELPDGLAIDNQDRLFCAVWGGSGVLQLGTGGLIETRIALDAHWPTSVAFGGPKYDSLFVTSARPDSQTCGDVTPGSNDGCVMRLVGCGHGRPEHPSRLGL